MYTTVMSALVRSCMFTTFPIDPGYHLPTTSAKHLSSLTNGIIELARAKTNVQKIDRIAASTAKTLALVLKLL